MFILPFALFALAPMIRQPRCTRARSARTHTRGAETGCKRAAASRTCKFLSVCGAAAAVKVMQAAIDIDEDLRAGGAPKVRAASRASLLRAAAPRLEMTEVAAVETWRQTANYTHTSNFIPQQKNNKHPTKRFSSLKTCDPLHCRPSLGRHIFAAEKPVWP